MIYIVMDGGLVQDVITDDPKADSGETVAVIDYDVEGADLEDLTVMADGTEAYLSGQDMSEWKDPENIGIVRSALGLGSWKPKPETETIPANLAHSILSFLETCMDWGPLADFAESLAKQLCNETGIDLPWED